MPAGQRTDQPPRPRSHDRPELSEYPNCGVTENWQRQIASISHDFHPTEPIIMSNMNRRIFLGSSLAAGLTATRALADEKKAASPNEKVTVALVGCGGMGMADLRDFLRVPEVEVAALCDPDEARIASALAGVKKAGRDTEKIQTVQDFRKIIDRKDIDAVIVGTPDHWHAY